MKINCDISDAKEDLEKLDKHFLEHLFRNENEISSETEINVNNFYSWLKKKKILWKRLDNKKYNKIKIKNKVFDISNNEKINKILISNGIFYHMRDSYAGKPSFLLAKIIKLQKKKQYTVIILGKELARDLRRSYYSQCELIGNHVFCRMEAEKFYFSELIKKIKLKRLKRAEKEILISGLKSENLTLDDIVKNFDSTLEKQTKIHISHELGHAITRDKKIFPNKLFFSIANNFSYTDIEWFMDAIHEVLAETVDGGRISMLIKTNNFFLTSLFFYEGISNFNVHPILEFKNKILFGNKKNLKKMFLESAHNKNFSSIEKMRSETYEEMKNFITKIKNINKISNKQVTRKNILKIINQYK